LGEPAQTSELGERIRRHYLQYAAPPAGVARQGTNVTVVRSHASLGDANGS
jgi:hypothetical protein